jgi:putative nucleotidyltransferase with HDIG domain
MNYVSFEMKNITPEQELPGNIYLFVSGHFIKYKSKSDVFPSKKYNELIVKKVFFIFIELEQLEGFNNWSKGVIEEDEVARRQQLGEQNEEVFEIELAIKDGIWKAFTEILNEESYKTIHKDVSRLIGKVNDNMGLQGALCQIHENGQVFSQHSYNVATLSVYLAINLGHNQPNFLQTIFIGGLFHDYGKLQFSGGNDELDIIGQEKLFEKRHPVEGRILLSKKTEMPLATLKIIEEHHERFDGKGFPNKLKRNQISEPSQIVSIANIYDNYFSKGQGTYKEKQIYALKNLGKHRGTYFDKIKLDKCMKILYSTIKKTV